jgi:branched-chain amino acid transport system ATP-binding protein
MSMVLRVQALHQHYGDVHALKGVSFELQAGQCVAMIGPNGAGKSTCFACLAGQQIASQGQVFWRAHALSVRPAHDRLALGVARTFQVAQVFEALTVLQNLQLVLQARRGVSVADVLDQCHLDEAMHWVQKMGLANLGEHALYAPAQNLSYGAKKRLELALALAGLSDPSSGLLLLDEPAAGLSPSERTDMMQRVKRLADEGTTVLYTEHNMDAVFGVADRVLVLMEGALVAEGSPEEVAAHPLVQERYLGAAFVGSTSSSAKHPPAGQGDTRHA